MPFKALTKVYKAPSFTRLRLPLLTSTPALQSPYQKTYGTYIHRGSQSTQTFLLFCDCSNAISKHFLYVSWSTAKMHYLVSFALLFGLIWYFLCGDF